MEVAITLPEDVAYRLQLRWSDIPKRTLEALAVEAYRSGALTAAEVQRLLHLSSRWEVNERLKELQTYLNYTEEDLEHFAYGGDLESPADNV